MPVAVLEFYTDCLQTIRAHAESTYPDECCGLLLGKLDDEHSQTKTVVEIWATENVWSAEIANSYLLIDQSIAKASSSVTVPEPGAFDQILTKTDHYYCIAPEAMLKGQRYALSRGLEVIGLYHSHPDHPAIPSQFDQDLAWPKYSYVIVFVQNGTSQDLRSWVLDETHHFQHEEIVVIKPMKT